MLIDSDSKYSKALNFLQKPHNSMVVDLETTGLNVWGEDRLCGIAIYADGKSFYFPFRHGGADTPGNIPLKKLEDFKKVLTRSDVTYIGWNYKFDMQNLFQDGIPFPTKIEDPMLAAHLMNENEYLLNTEGKVVFRNGKPATVYQLKTLSDRYLEETASLEESILIDKIIAAGFTKSKSKAKGEMWRLPASDVAAYAEQDVILTQRMRDFYVPHLVNWKLYDIWQETNNYEQLITEIETNGMQIDPVLTAQYIAEANQHTEELESQIRAMAGYNINLKSSKQVCAFLGVNSSAKDVLEEMDTPAAKIMQEYRQWSKVNDTYYKQYLEEMDKNNRLHTSLLLTGTVTGRLASIHPNLQAVPRKSSIYKVKDIFVAWPDHVLVQADYSQAEMRLGTHYAQEKRMAEKILRGADVHTETAGELGIPRDAAKRINFGVIYDIGKVSLAQQLKIEENLAGQYLSKYRAGYPGFKALSRRAERMASERGYIRMWTGRIKRYDQYNPTRKAMSNLIQGGVAEIIRTTMLRLHREVPEAIQVLQVHDSVLFQIPRTKLNASLPKIKMIMEDYQFDLPMTVDIEYGLRWGSLQKWNGKKINMKGLK